MGTHERKEREKEHRREEILDAAQTVFFEKGLAVATMDEIRALPAHRPDRPPRLHSPFGDRSATGNCQHPGHGHGTATGNRSIADLAQLCRRY